MKDHPRVFKLPEYGDLWSHDDPNHARKCVVAELQSYTPRGLNKTCPHAFYYHSGRRFEPEGEVQGSSSNRQICGKSVYIGVYTGILNFLLRFWGLGPIPLHPERFFMQLGATDAQNGGI